MTDIHHNEKSEWEQRDIASVFHHNSDLALHQQRGPMVITRGKGVRVWDDRERCYIEGMAGLWCTAIGYGNEELADVAAEQIRTLSYAHLFSNKSHPPVVELAEMLKAMLPMAASKIMFMSSGSEANDTQIKLVRYYNNAIGRPHKKKIISRMKAYHGTTLATASLTGLPAFHKDFDLPIEGVLHTDCAHYANGAEPGESETDYAQRIADNLRALIEREGPETIAAFIAEPVMAAGGLMVPPATYFDRITPILKEYDILFIDDEVVCGFGRTGQPFGAQTMNFTPDTMTLAKALSSAYIPISAIAVPDKLYDAFIEQSRKLGVFGHGFTYGGHPVAAAVAVRNLQIMERISLFDHAAKMAPIFQRHLRSLSDHPLAGEVNGIGLMGVVALVSDKASHKPFDPGKRMGFACANACAESGLILRCIGDRMVLCPPLIINEEEIKELFECFRKGLDLTLQAV